VILKRCTGCKTAKPLLAFARNRNASDGLQHQCRACSSEMQQKYRGRKTVKINNRRLRPRMMWGAVGFDLYIR
jgi:hypothetical protein